MTSEKTRDVESQDSAGAISHWRMIRDQGIITPEIEHWEYEGSGTEEDPYAVVWIDNDPRNPMQFRAWYRVSKNLYRINPRN
jgi:hypothetical protein